MTACWIEPNYFNEYTAVIKQKNDWWVGWIEEVPGVNCQEKTHGELKEALEHNRGVCQQRCPILLRRLRWFMVFGTPLFWWIKPYASHWIPVPNVA